jgi:uncharacterized membrane protein YhaH (DUF805 family)
MIDQLIALLILLIVVVVVFVIIDHLTLPSPVPMLAKLIISLIVLLYLLRTFVPHLALH